MVNPNANVDLYSLLSDSEELTHYGRKGMKWYQHIYGPVQAVAQYAKKAKAKHDEKKQSKWETKKEAIIRSGDAKKIDKYKNYLSDDEMKRATNRLDSSGKLNTAIGKKQVEKSKDMSAQEIINNFSNFAKNAKNIVEAVDTLNSTLDKAKKYLPENQKKAKEVSNAIANLDVNFVRNNPGRLNNDQMKDFNNRLRNFKGLIDNDNALNTKDVSNLSAFTKTESKDKFASYKDYKRINDMIKANNVNMNQKGKGNNNSNNNVSKEKLKDLIREVMDEEK